MWKVQVRGKAPAEGPAWRHASDGPEDWLGEWVDLGIDGTEDYCRGWADGAQFNYREGPSAYRAVPCEEA